MPSEKGIFIKILPALDMAAMAAVVTQMKSIFGKAGADISKSLDGPAQAIKRLENDMISANNRAADLQYRAAVKTAQANAIQERAAKAATVAEEKRSAAQVRALEIADAASARANAAQAAASKAHDDATESARKHSDALNESAAATNVWAKAQNAAGMAATGLFVGIGAESLKASTSYEQALTRIQAATDMSVGNISTLHQGLLQLSSEMGTNLKDLTDAAYQVAKSGGIFRDAATDINFLRDAIKLAKIDAVPLTDVIAGATTTINDFNISADRMTDVLARMKTAAGDLKVGNIGDLARSLDNLEPRVAAATITPNMSQDDRLKQQSQTLAMIDRLVSTGAPPDQATQWLNNALKHISNPTGPQAQFLGGLLAKNNMAPSDLAKGLQDPNKGQLWAFEEIQRAIDANRGPDGNVSVPVRQLNKDLISKLGLARNDLRSPQERGIADLMIQNAQSGAIPTPDERKLFRQASMLPDMKSFVQVYNKAFGYSNQMTNQTPMSVPYATALNMATGTDSGAVTGQALFGSKENAQLTQDKYNQIQNQSSKSDLDKSFDLVKDTSAWKIADLKTQMHALAVVVGDELMPQFKAFLDVMKDLINFFGNHKGALDAFIHSLETMAALWTTGKIINGMQATRTGLEGLFGVMQRAGAQAATTGGQMTQAATGAERVGQAAGTATGPVSNLGQAETRAAEGASKIAQTATAAAEGESRIGGAAATAAGEVGALATAEERAAINAGNLGIKLQGLKNMMPGLVGAGLGGFMGFTGTNGNLGDKLNAGTDQALIGAGMMGGLPGLGVAGLGFASKGFDWLLGQGGKALGLDHAGQTAPGGSSNDLRNMSLNDAKGVIDKIPAGFDPGKLTALADGLEQAGKGDIADYIRSKFNLPKPVGGAYVAPPPETAPQPENADTGPVSFPTGGGGGGGGGGGRGGGGGGSGYGGDSGYATPNFPALYSTANSLMGTPYGQGGIDCSGLATALIHPFLGDGKGMSDRLTTANAGTWLPAHGFVMGEPPGAGYLTVGWYNHGSGTQDGHMAVTMPDGTNLEQGGAADVVTTHGAGAFSSEFDHHAYFPIPQTSAMGGGGGGMGGMGGGMGGMGGGMGGGGFGTPTGNPLEQAASGGFTLPNIARMATTFLMELAMGNPLGHLMNNPMGKYAWWLNKGSAGDMMGGGGRGRMPGMPDISGMNSDQLRTLNQTNKLTEAQERLNAAIARYGQNSRQAYRAAEQLRDLQISQAESNDKHATALEHHAEAQAKKDAKAKGGGGGGEITVTPPPTISTSGDGNGNITVTTPSPGRGGPSTWGFGGFPLDPGSLFGGGGGGGGFHPVQPAPGGGGMGGPMGGRFGPLTPVGGGVPGKSPWWGPGHPGAPQPGTGVPGMGMTGAAPGAPGMGAPGAPGGAPVGGGQLPGSGSSAGGGANIGSGKGMNVSGGAIGMAESAASTAADMFAPGSGAAVQLAMQEANRAAAYMGQMAGIAVAGLGETFKLHDPDGGGGVSDKPGWVSKIAGGIAGAHVNAPNSAGETAPQVKKPSDKQTGKADGPGGGKSGIHIENQNFYGDNQADAVGREQTANMMMYDASTGSGRAGIL